MVTWCCCLWAVVVWMGALCGGFVLLKLSPQKTDRDRDTGICSFVRQSRQE
jgi:hypothetical protein